MSDSSEDKNLENMKETSNTKNIPVVNYEENSKNIDVLPIEQVNLNMIDMDLEDSEEIKKNEVLECELKIQNDYGDVKTKKDDVKSNISTEVQNEYNTSTEKEKLDCIDVE